MINKILFFAKEPQTKKNGNVVFTILIIYIIPYIQKDILQAEDFLDRANTVNSIDNVQEYKKN